jgi:hypothetical protein
MTEQRLSDFLLSHVDLYGMDGANRPSKKDQEARFFLAAIAVELIEAREAFTGEKFALYEKALQNEPEITEGEIDRVVSCRALQSVSGMVKRLILLSKLDGIHTPSDQTSLYIREAARTYVHGFMQASAAMSRAAVEQALKEKTGLQGSEDHIGFKELVKRATKMNILDPTAADQALKHVAYKANAVLHHGPADNETTLRVLDAARGVLRHVYGM